VRDKFPRVENGKFVPGHCKGDGTRGAWMWGTVLGGGGANAINDKWAGDTQGNAQSSDFPQCRYPGNRPLLISPQNKCSVQLPPVLFSCMYVCVYIYWYVYAHRYMCMCAYTYENIYTCIYIHKYTHMCTYQYIYVHISIYIYTHTHTRMCIHIYVYTYIYPSTSTYIDTHTNTHTHPHPHTQVKKRLLLKTASSSVLTSGNRYTHKWQQGDKWFEIRLVSDVGTLNEGDVIEIQHLGLVQVTNIVWCVIHTYIPTYIPTRIHSYTHTHTHTYTHTHTHTHTYAGVCSL